MPKVNKNISNKELANLLKKKKAVIKYYEKLEAIAKGRLQKGEKIDGLRLAPGTISRRWKDEKKAFNTLVDLGIPKSDLTDGKMVSFPKLSKNYRFDEQLVEKLVEIKRGEERVETENAF